MIEKAFQKHGKIVRGASQLHKYKRETFLRANAILHPTTNKYLVDPSDELRIKELIAGSAPASFTVNLEHYCDEFRSYIGDSEENKGYPANSQNEIVSFIYSAFQ